MGFTEGGRRRVFVLGKMGALLLGMMSGLATADPEDWVLYAQQYRRLEARVDEVTTPFRSGRFPAPVGLSNLGLVQNWLIPALCEIDWRAESFDSQATECRQLHRTWRNLLNRQIEWTETWTSLVTNGDPTRRAEALRQLALLASEWSNHRAEMINGMRRNGLTPNPLF